MPCQHRSAGDKYRRHIDPRRRHQKPRHILIAVGHHHQSVKLMCQCHTLRRIRDQISRYQGIFHAGMSHSNTVTDCNCRKYHRYAACLCNAHLYGIYNLIQIHVPRYNLIVRTYNTDQGFIHFFLCKSQRIKQGTVGRLLHPFFYIITSHLSLSFSELLQIFSPWNTGSATVLPGTDFKQL